MVRSQAEVQPRRGERPGCGPPPAPVSGRLVRPASLARAHAVFDGVWALQLPLCYRSVASVNAYLLTGADGCTLVDCGSMLDPGWAAMETALAGAGVAPREISLLVLSHAHADHAGLAAEVVERTGCRVAKGPGPHPFLDRLRDPVIPLELRRARAAVEGVPATWIDRMVDDLPGDDRCYPAVGPADVLEPGVTLASACGGWEVRAAPGHSADQIVLHNEHLRALISADLALGGPASFLEYGTRADPHADQVASLDAAIGLGAAVLLPGHGRPVREAADFLCACRRKVLDRVSAVQAVLGPEPRSGFQVAAALTPAGADAGQWQRSLAEALSVLEHLEQRDAVRHVIGDDGVRAWLPSYWGSPGTGAHRPSRTS